MPATTSSHLGLCPLSMWPSLFWYRLDKSISTYKLLHPTNPLAPQSLLHIQNEQVKRKCLSKQNSVWLSASMGKFPWMCQSLCCKIAPPTCNPHFPMTRACQSLTKSKPNFMPSKDPFVNHFACHTSTRITWQLQLLLSIAVGLVKLFCLS